MILPSSGAWAQRIVLTPEESAVFGREHNLPADFELIALFTPLTSEVRVDVENTATKAVRKDGAEPNQSMEQIIQIGTSFRYRVGFGDVWLGNNHFNLRERKKARLCIEYLVEKKAFNAASARHLVTEIDVYVRTTGDFQPSAEIKIDHYFNDHTGRLPKLRKDLILSAGRDGKFYLMTD